MILDLERDIEGPHSGFDVCVVGAGASGITLATELSKLGSRVLLLEAGGIRQEIQTQKLYQSEIIGLPHKGIQNGRFRGLGGSTSEWGGQILELDEIDFRHRPWVPGSGWPISKADLRPYYERAIEFVGLRPALANTALVIDELRAARPDLGNKLDYAVSYWCPERNFSITQRETLRKSRDLITYVHANACELLLNDDGSVVTEIVCRTLNGREQCFSARHFVLCLGGIETSRFLLQPHHEGRAPWHSSQWVGRRFQDHISCVAATLTNVRFPIRRSFDYLYSGGNKYHPKLKLPAATQEHLQLLNACGTVIFSTGDDQEIERAYKIIRMMRNAGLTSLGSGDSRHLLRGLPGVMWRSLNARLDRTRFYRPKHSSAKLCVHCEQSPTSSSRISLSPERDELGLFRAQLDWTISEIEIETIRKYTQITREAFAQNNLADLVFDEELFSRTPDMNIFKDSNHHMSGTRMAHTKSAGVVDTDLRLFEMKNLFVCSSSVFPNSGFSNPTHTILALCMRLADHLHNLNERRQHG